MLYVERVRRYAKEMPIHDAVTHAVEECIQEEILKDFLTKYRAEAIEVSIFEYDEEAHMKLVRAEGLEQGEWKKLISLVQKKLEKGLEADEIAEILEEEPVFIRKIIKILEKNQDKTEEEILSLVMREVL